MMRATTLDMELLGLAVLSCFAKSMQPNLDFLHLRAHTCLSSPLNNLATHYLVGQRLIYNSLCSNSPER